MKATYQPVTRHVPGFYSLDEAAQKLGLARTTVRIWAWEGKLESYKPSPRVVLIPKTAVSAFIRERTRPSRS